MCRAGVYYRYERPQIKPFLYARLLPTLLSWCCWWVHPGNCCFVVYCRLVCLYALPPPILQPGIQQAFAWARSRGTVFNVTVLLCLRVCVCVYVFRAPMMKCAIVRAPAYSYATKRARVYFTAAEKDVSPSSLLCSSAWYGVETTTTTKESIKRVPPAIYGIFMRVCIVYRLLWSVCQHVVPNPTQKAKLHKRTTHES